MEIATEEMRDNLLKLGLSPELARTCVDLTLTGMWDHKGAGGAPSDLLNDIFTSMRIHLESRLQYEKRIEGNSRTVS